VPKSPRGEVDLYTHALFFTASGGMEVAGPILLKVTL